MRELDGILAWYVVTGGLVCNELDTVGTGENYDDGIKSPNLQDQNSSRRNLRLDDVMMVTADETIQTKGTQV
jgi:hypothetical protein